MDFEYPAMRPFPPVETLNEREGNIDHLFDSFSPEAGRGAPTVEAPFLVSVAKNSGGAPVGAYLAPGRIMPMGNPSQSGVPTYNGVPLDAVPPPVIPVSGPLTHIVLKVVWTNGSGYQFTVETSADPYSLLQDIVQASTWTSYMPAGAVTSSWAVQQYIRNNVGVGNYGMINAWWAV
jgi:hypothetical protein